MSTPNDGPAPHGPTAQLCPSHPPLKVPLVWVPALGYLDKVDQLLEKAKDNKLTNAEFLILQGQDLALLARFEQAKDLTVTLLKNWPRMLGDNKLWHSHGRMIGPATLKRVLRLEINDYSEDSELRPLIRSYNDLLTDYIARGPIRVVHAAEREGEPRP